jgi:WD40 repeat protein
MQRRVVSLVSALVLSAALWPPAAIPTAAGFAANDTAGSWSATSSMAVARGSMTATLLANGRVLVVGGAQESSTELYDQSSGSWMPGGTLNVPRWLHAAVRLPDGRVLVAGGGAYTSTAELYNPATNSWTPTGSMSIDRYDFSGTLLHDGRVLVVGGYSLSAGGQSTARVELYNPATGTWALTGSLRTPRRNHTATLLPNGTVLVAGGFNAGGWLRSAELYDPARGRWSRVAPMTTAREHASAVLLGDGRVLMAGGGNPSALQSAELYDPAANRWTRTGSMNGYGGTATLLPDGRVLVACCDAADVYSPATGTWTPTGPMVFPYASAAAALLPNGQVLYAGGGKVKYCGQYSCSEPIADAELYTP